MADFAIVLKDEALSPKQQINGGGNLIVSQPVASAEDPGHLCYGHQTDKAGVFAGEAMLQQLFGPFKLQKVILNEVTHEDVWCRDRSWLVAALVTLDYAVGNRFIHLFQRYRTLNPDRRKARAEQ